MASSNDEPETLGASSIVQFTLAPGESIMKLAFVEWLRRQIPAAHWKMFWWLAPAAILLMFPVGVLAVRCLELTGWGNESRPEQGLILFSPLCGLIGGSILLWSVGSAGLDPRLLHRVQWLNRFSVVGPLLEIFAAFWIVRLFTN
jgi:hypothetical protein